ncbi:uncharacterized protein I303_103550 [Kwoniella dejecticola CBS 10117]|uniref:Transcription elongation factor 1 homolog n=1 Tax=Kwoniella dejecticola CBS 10117 TaxID=1296121 RepID=A0A1A6A730_9TREE|nr:uncharacterized protein I303_03572 [Kwoniella dejecticola CBS 10117]OBR85858.1 hypothetical protein I303_03572 [Kwoniella dejecticola CBS 10117]
MGKRKAAKKPQAKKKAEPLSSVFKCLFCNHEKAVTVKIDKQSMFGHLSCKVCGQKFTSPVNNLSVPVDVYCDWVDACEEVRARQPVKQRPVRAPSPLAHGQAGGAAFDSDGPQDQDEDAEGEEEDYDSRARSRPKSSKTSRREEVDEEEEEEADLDEDDLDADGGGRRDKRRRVREDYDDEDEDD